MLWSSLIPFVTSNNSPFQCDIKIFVSLVITAGFCRPQVVKRFVIAGLNIYVASLLEPRELVGRIGQADCF